MKPLLILALLGWVSCSAPPPLPPASTQAQAVARTVLPVLNATFPFRVEAKPVVPGEPVDPLGTRRIPTDQIVLRETSGAATGPVPADAGALAAAWTEANQQPVEWPPSVTEAYGVVPFRTVKAGEGGWWSALAKQFPRASSLVTLSRPGFSADGRFALVSALVETPRPPRIEYFYRLERDGEAWVVTHSDAREVPNL